MKSFFKSSLFVVTLVLTFHGLTGNPLPIAADDDSSLDDHGDFNFQESNLETTTTKIPEGATSDEDSHLIIQPDEEIDSATSYPPHLFDLDSAESDTEAPIQQQTEPSLHFTPTEPVNYPLKLDFGEFEEVPDELEAKSFDFNEYAHDDSRDWFLLKINGQRLDFQNHVHQNNDYFQQIIEKFGRVDEIIAFMKANIEKEKIETTSRFESTSKNIGNVDDSSKQRQAQLFKGISNNRLGLQTIISDRQKDRARDQEESGKMKDGIDKQIAGVSKSMRDNFSQMSEKLANLEGVLKSQNNLFDKKPLPSLS